MSFEITEAFVDQFRSNVIMLSQQKGSRLRMSVRQESQRGKLSFFERIGAVTAVEKATRHSDTPQIDTPHSRRAVSMRDYIYADLIDEEDKVRTLIDPTNPYAQAAMWAHGRKMDDVIIEALQGNSYGGQAGQTAIPLPDSQKLLSFTSGPVTPVRLNVDALRRAKEVLDGNDIDPSIRRYCVLNARQLRALLEETEVTSSDFNTVRALVRGELDEFLGFTFIRMERVPQADAKYDASGNIDAGGGNTLSNADHVLCYASDGMVLSVGRDMTARIDPRPDKNYATQVYTSMSIGAVRLEEEMVVDIACALS